MLIDPHNPVDIANAEGINSHMVTRAIAMDGTCTGEHGVGMHKMAFLIEEHGSGAIHMMRALKHAFDPGNIMNPGKIIAWDDPHIQPKN